MAEDAGPIVASVNLSNVVRGVFQACHLGYSVDAAHEGRGIAFEAVGAVVRFAFAELRLHRVMANYQPTNERSAKLLRRLGFTAEGYARDYLYINGGWRDHVLTSLSNPDWVPAT
jgi:ribosomal-protein-alanine N-acetyltransferase